METGCYMTIVDNRTTRIFEWSRPPVCPSIAVLSENSAARTKDTRPAPRIMVSHLSRIPQNPADTIDYTFGSRTTIA